MSAGDGRSWFRAAARGIGRVDERLVEQRASDRLQCIELRELRERIERIELRKRGGVLVERIELRKRGGVVVLGNGVPERRLRTQRGGGERP